MDLEKNQRMQILQKKTFLIWKKIETPVHAKKSFLKSYSSDRIKLERNIFGPIFFFAKKLMDDQRNFRI